MKAGTRPVKLRIPSSFEELIAIGMGHDPVRRLVHQMVPEVCSGPLEDELVTQEESANPFGPSGIIPKVVDTTGQATTGTQ